MAIIDSRGFVDDGSDDLIVGGNVQAIGTITCSNGSFGELSTVGAISGGQLFGAPNTFAQINQWLTASITTSGVKPTPTGSIVVNTPGMYMTNVSLSFSGSAGTWTFSLFQNGIQHPNCQVQQTISSGQSFPENVSLVDLNSYNSGDTLDLRVRCSNAGANFLMNNGNFIVSRVLG